MSEAGGLRAPGTYGWVIVGVAFVTMGVAVNTRTAFSLLFPPILDELGWDRGLTAGAFSFGFVVSALLSPLVGWLIDRRGPRVVVEAGIAAMAAGLLLATRVREPWQLYATLGLLVGAGGNCLGYTTHALVLSRWFVRRRGLATSVAFSGVGVGSIVILPGVQAIIAADGWRAACWTLGVLAVALLGPLNLLLRAAPADRGLRSDGDRGEAGAAAGERALTVVDPAWAAIDWTLSRAIRTRRFWWIAAGYFAAMFAWYAVQVHQTKYLVEVGFGPGEAAWALGAVSLVAVPGQVTLGHLSDRIGREWVWTAGCAGFAGCYVALLLLARAPGPALLGVVVASQGLLGYGLTSVIGAIPAEIFAGRHHGTIFGTLMLAAIAGGAAGPWVAGVLHDLTGSYDIAFSLAIACSGISSLAIWLAAPRRVRAVSLPRRRAGRE